MRVLFDAVQRSLTVDDTEAQPWGADIRAEIARYGQTIGLSNVQFGVTVSVNGAPTSHQWPESGVSYVQTDQDVVATYRALWAPDDTIKIDAWTDSDIGRVETTHTFTAPRPPQPFPSWTWLAGAWTPPVPHPGGDLEWDESTLSWETR